MCPGPTFDRVYRALKEQVTSGSFAPGEHLEPTALGDTLNASITPVRDALHRLVGERIVAAPRHDGFQVPAPTEAEVRNLYGWNRELLDIGLRARRPVIAAGGADAAANRSGPIRQLTDDLFVQIARRSGNPEHEQAVEILNDRLGSLRHAEERLFEDARTELSALQQALAEEDITALRRQLAAYHRRRQRNAPELLARARHG